MFRWALQMVLKNIPLFVYEVHNNLQIHQYMLSMADYYIKIMCSFAVAAADSTQ